MLTQPLVINVEREHLLSLRQAAGEFGSLRGGRKPHISTVYRWITRGVRGVKLESLRIGGERSTSKEAIRRFVRRLNEGDGSSGSSSAVANETDCTAVARALDEAGI